MKIEIQRKIKLFAALIFFIPLVAGVCLLVLIGSVLLLSYTFTHVGEIWFDTIIVGIWAAAGAYTFRVWREKKK